MAAMRAVIAMSAAEDLELDSVDVSTAFLNGEIDAEIYMKIPMALMWKVDRTLVLGSVVEVSFLNRVR